MWSLRIPTDTQYLGAKGIGYAHVGYVRFQTFWGGTVIEGVQVGAPNECSFLFLLQRSHHPGEQGLADLYRLSAV